MRVVSPTSRLGFLCSAGHNVRFTNYQEYKSAVCAVKCTGQYISQLCLNGALSLKLAKNGDCCRNHHLFVAAGFLSEKVFCQSVSQNV
ncbi:hypothetical protein Pan153_40140 [Gimesia panareensis]|uniref:Uncharacterized protein n=1 Tax=Gimesia panareensis TaxID=2527978 RepID=A0A518FSN6_9PLAN|nr:hypothetical protein Pan153_40140 [Gimesia panareensis]